MVSVEIISQFSNTSVQEVEFGLEGAVSQYFILPLGQNQESISTCWYHLKNTNFQMYDLLSKYKIHYSYVVCDWLVLVVDKIRDH